MKKTFLIFPVIFATGLTSCILSKKSADNSVIKYVTRNTTLVKEAAKFAVSVTYDQKKKDFIAKDVPNKDIRNKIASLGSSVYVTYKSEPYSEIPDSNVTFTTMTLFGLTEVIYDFAATPRTFADSTKNRQEYYFVNLLTEFTIDGDRYR